MTTIKDLLSGIYYNVRVAGINSRGIGTFSAFGFAQTYRGGSFFSILYIKEVIPLLFFSVVPNTTSPSEIQMSLHPGQIIRLSCWSSGFPQPLIIWHRDDVQLVDRTANVQILTMGNLSELYVRDLFGENGGQYKCNGTNVAGSSSLLFMIACELLLGIINILLTPYVYTV